MFRKSLAVLGFALLAAAPLNAATYDPPLGIQSDVEVSDVLSGGWSTVYSGTYGSYVSYNAAFNNLEDWLILASRKVGSATFDLLAAIRVSDWNALPTGRNQTASHNGAEWYRNGSSMGFAPEGAAITQNSADTVDAFGGDVSGTGDFRLSWHTSGYYGAPTAIRGGWRSGNNIWLNSSSDWERYVLTASDADLSAVPLPASGLLLVAGLAGVAALRRRKTV
ncbi:VPLPA-CTERM sorting domain-containing protein [Tropicimonas sp. S265A]|uniref:VPLPA-CTERM sorting domain-containing protein n=1 Tax=Tropicimonas sp. S265A TaxID=3415134 RepID=UPI003C7B91B3